MKAKKVLLEAVSFLIFIILVVGMVSHSAKAVVIRECDVYVGGIMVTDENANDVLGDGTVSINRQSNKLTLKNAHIKTGLEIDEQIIAIYSEGDIWIELEGENIIEAPDHDFRSYGIKIDGNITISGDSLLVRGGNITPKKDEFIADSRGILCSVGLEILGANVDAYGGEIQGILDDSITVGIYVGGYLEVKQGGSLSAFGGNIGGNCTKASSYGIMSVGNANRLSYVSVDGGTITAIGGKVTAMKTATSAGLYAEYSDFSVYRNESNIFFEGGESTAVDVENEMETYANSQGAYISGGKFRVDGGNVSITSKECNGVENTKINGDALCVYTAIVKDEKVGGVMEINGMNIVQNSYGYGFSGTDVYFKSESGRAVACEVDTLIDVRLEITFPEGAGQYKDSDGFCVIKTTPVDATAAEVTIGARVYEISVEDAERKLSVIVPYKKTVNETYCEKVGIKDFSEYLKTEKEGFVFEGWYSDSEFTQVFDFNALIYEDMTVYGKWVSASAESVAPESSEISEIISEEQSTVESSDTSSEMSDAEKEESTSAFPIIIITAVICAVLVVFIVFKKRTK